MLLLEASPIKWMGGCCLLRSNSFGLSNSGVSAIKTAFFFFFFCAQEKMLKRQVARLLPSLRPSITSSSPLSTYSTWSHVIKGPEDPILGVTLAFNKDTSPQKMNLGVGAYRDDNGQPYILDTVKEVKRFIRLQNYFSIHI